MLELCRVTVRRGGRCILDAVDFRLAPGEHVALTGPSGGGKSTLLKAVLLLEAVDDGRVVWKGQVVTPVELAAHRNRFLYIGQKPLPFDGSAQEYLDLPFTFASNRSLRADRRRQEELLAHVGMDASLLKHSYGRLSGGEQQRLTIVQGMQLERPFCLLDEVTSSLDPEARLAVIRLFARETDRGILAVTHNREWLEEGFTEVSLEKGKLVRQTCTKP